MPHLRTTGARVHYQRRGSGPAVLMLQGVGVIGEGWRPQVDALADRFTLITIDNRGIGRSEITDGPLTIEAMATDALAVMDAEQVERFHLAGHSMGGVIAQEIALRVPDRVMSLSLLCTFLHGRDGARMSAGMLVTALRMRIGTRAMRRNAFLELVIPAGMLRQADRAHLAAELASLFGRDLAEQPPIVMRQLHAMARYDAASRLGELRGVPTLVVSAAEDRISRPEDGRGLAAAIPGARLVALPRAAHGLPIHSPADVNELLAQHFTSAQELLSEA